jgi:putative mRNA 3-end processing factor
MRSIGPIVVHGAVAALNEAYRAAGVSLPATLAADRSAHRPRPALRRRAGGGAAGGAWQRLGAPLGDCSDAFASGWMQLRGARRRQGVDRGFVLSDHADWPGLQRPSPPPGAERVIVTHG